MTSLNKRATVYFDPAIHKAVKLKALETEQSISEVIDEALRQELLEDAEDLAAFEKRAKEPAISFEKFIKELKAHGEI